MPFFVLILKSVFLTVFAIAARGTMPRYRFDQLTQLNWKHFVFVWIGFLIFNMGFLIFFF